MRLNKIFAIAVEILVASAASSAHAQTDPYCEYYLTEARADIKAGTDDIQHVYSKLKVDLNDYELIESLGHGASGGAFKVTKDGKPYVLKILLDSEQSYASVTETTDAVLIQYALGQMGLAAEVYGIIETPQLQPWMIKNLATLNRLTLQHRHRPPPFNSRFAIIMEYVEGTSLKFSKGQIVHLNHREWTRAQSKAQLIDDAITELKLEVNDPDFIVKANGDVRLIDLSWYRLPKRAEEFFPRYTRISRLLNSLQRAGIIQVLQ